MAKSKIEYSAGFTSNSKTATRYSQRHYDWNDLMENEMDCPLMDSVCSLCGFVPLDCCFVAKGRIFCQNCCVMFHRDNSLWRKSSLVSHDEKKDSKVSVEQEKLEPPKLNFMLVEEMYATKKELATVKLDLNRSIDALESSFDLKISNLKLDLEKQIIGKMLLDKHSAKEPAIAETVETKLESNSSNEFDGLKNTLDNIKMAITTVDSDLESKIRHLDAALIDAYDLLNRKSETNSDWYQAATEQNDNLSDIDVETMVVVVNSETDTIDANTAENDEVRKSIDGDSVLDIEVGTKQNNSKLNLSKDDQNVDEVERNLKSVPFQTAGISLPGSTKTIDYIDDAISKESQLPNRCPDVTLSTNPGMSPNNIDTARCDTNALIQEFDPMMEKAVTNPDEPGISKMKSVSWYTSLEEISDLNFVADSKKIDSKSLNVVPAFVATFATGNDKDAAVAKPTALADPVSKKKKKKKKNKKNAEVPLVLPNLALLRRFGDDLRSPNYVTLVDDNVKLGSSEHQQQMKEKEPHVINEQHEDEIMENETHPMVAVSSKPGSVKNEESAKISNPVTATAEKKSKIKFAEKNKAAAGSTASNYGSLVWDIGDFSAKMSSPNAESKLNSPPFYSGEKGYKMRMLLCFLKTEIGVFLEFLGGEHDHLIPSVFHHRRTFYLHDQRDDVTERRHVTVSQEPSFGSSDAETWMTTCWGLRSFASYALLLGKESESVYLRKDTIRVRVVVEPLASLIGNYFSNDGALTWRIDGYRRMKQESVSKVCECFRSECFYSAPCGYRMQVYLFFKQGQLKLWLCFLEGEFDLVLQDVFPHKVAFEIVDQSYPNGDGANLFYEFPFDARTASRKEMLRKAMCSAGCSFAAFAPKYFEKKPYLVKDTLVIKVKVVPLKEVDR